MLTAFFSAGLAAAGGGAAFGAGHNISPLFRIIAPTTLLGIIREEGS
jgi:hypothetical protein